MIARTVRHPVPRRFGRVTTTLLLITLVAGLDGGCFPKRLKGPDLAEIYNRAAQYHHVKRNPVIVIPGIMGSKLVDDDSGTVVWGAFTGEYARPNTPDGAPLVALPMREGVPLSELHDSVRPDGVLDRVRVSFMGIPLRILAYFYILGALGAGGYSDQDLGLSGAIDYGSDHYTCFQFPYDWRRDISESATQLATFIEEKRGYVRDHIERHDSSRDPEIKFDIVAHSMGGLVARYYLRYGAQPLPEDGSLPPLPWEGARNVDNVILIGPPNAGSVDGLFDLVRGYKPGPTLRRYPAAVVGTMPAVYQLLPRGRHRSVVASDASGTEAIDPLDAEVWEAMRWGLASPEQDEVLGWLLPDLPDSAARRSAALDHLRKSLKRARQFADAMDVPAELPHGVSMYLIVGDAEPTPAVVEVDAGVASGKLRVIERRPGDGKVLRASALMDERLSQSVEWTPRLISPIDWTHVTFLFRAHLELTKSPEFTDNVLFILLEKD